MRGFVLFVILSVASSGCLWWADEEPEAPAATGEPWPDQPLEGASQDGPATDPTPASTPTPVPTPTPTPAPTPEPADTTSDDEAPAADAAAQDAPASNATAGADTASATNSSAASNASASTNSTNTTSNATAGPPPSLDHTFAANTTVRVTQAPSTGLIGGPRMMSTGGCIQLAANATKNMTTAFKGGTVTASWLTPPGGAGELELGYFARGDQNATYTSGFSPITITLNATSFEGSASAPRITVALPRAGAPTAAVNQEVTLTVTLQMVGAANPRVQSCS